MTEDLEIIIIEDFLLKQNINYNITDNFTFYDGINELVKNKDDNNFIIVYNENINFNMNDYSLLNIDENGNFYIEYNKYFNGDIIDNININNSNIELSYYLYEVLYPYNDFNKYVLISSSFTPLKIRFTFKNKDLLPTFFILNYRSYFFNFILNI